MPEGLDRVDERDGGFRHVELVAASASAASAGST